MVCNTERKFLKYFKKYVSSYCVMQHLLLLVLIAMLVVGVAVAENSNEITLIAQKVGASEDVPIICILSPMGRACHADLTFPP